ncbi:hypothetical protein ALC62_14577, partial [Cyphomyrmex costatus]
NIYKDIQKLCFSVISVFKSILRIPTFREHCSSLCQGQEQLDISISKLFAKHWHSKNGFEHGITRETDNFCMKSACGNFKSINIINLVL